MGPARTWASAPRRITGCLVMNRRHFVWKLKNRELLAGERTLIMGVLNVTPDSFSDGGNFLDPDRAFARAIELEEQGADVIDIGAESTRRSEERRVGKECRPSW